MTTIEQIQIRADDTEQAMTFYSSVFGEDFPVVAIPGGVRPGGFDGFALSALTAQPGDVDLVIAHAANSGAKVLKPAKKSLWGYGGTLSAPDGTIIHVASETKKDSSPALRNIIALVLQLGVADVPASKNFYIELGLDLSKSYGKRYAEFATQNVSVILNRRSDAAKQAGVPDVAPQTHRLVVCSDAGSFTDPDGNEWR